MWYDYEVYKSTKTNIQDLTNIPLSCLYDCIDMDSKEKNLNFNVIYDKDKTNIIGVYQGFYSRNSSSYCISMQKKACAKFEIERNSKSRDNTYIVSSLYYKEGHLEDVIDFLLKEPIMLDKTESTKNEILDKIYRDNMYEILEDEDYNYIILKKKYNCSSAFNKGNILFDVGKHLKNSDYSLGINNIYFKLIKQYSIAELEENKTSILSHIYNFYNDRWSFLNEKDDLVVLCRYEKTYFNISKDSIILDKDDKGNKIVYSKDNKYEHFLIKDGFKYNTNKKSKNKTYYINYHDCDNDKLALTIIWYKKLTITTKYLKQNYAKYLNEKTNLVLYRAILRHLNQYLKKYKNITHILMNLPPTVIDDSRKKITCNNNYLFLTKKHFDVYSFIPKINRRYLEYFIKLGKYNLEFGDILLKYGIINNYKESASNYGYIYRNLIKIHKYIGIKNTKNILIDIIENSRKLKNIKYNIYLHDILLTITKIASKPFLTKKAKTILIYEFIPLFRFNYAHNREYEEKYDDFLNSIKLMDNIERSIKNLSYVNKIDKEQEIKNFRKIVSKYIKKYNLVECFTLLENKKTELYDMLYKEKKETYEKNYKINFEDKKVIDYLKRLNKYNDSISLFSLLDDFGADIKKFINGTYEGLFKKDYIYNGDEIIDYVLGIFAKKNKVAKKLYNDLRKSLDINKFLQRNLNIEEINQVISILQYRNLLANKQDWLTKYEIYGKIEQKCSPEFLISGDASVCCMSYGSQKIKTYAKEKGFGIFNVYFKNRIIANSLIWINSDKTFVIDNIEVHPNYDRFNSYIKNIYNSLIVYIKNNYDIDRVVQGQTYNDLTLYTKKNKKIGLELNPIEVNNYFYSDAEQCFIIG